MPHQPLVIWRDPATTLHFFILELGYQMKIRSGLVVKYQTKLCISLCCIVGLFSIMFFFNSTNAPHFLVSLRWYFVWCLYWLGLGILSSVGLGTGLHTFLLYLGPHIARVTVSAYECGSLDFPQPPYPDRIICPASSLSQIVMPFTSTGFKTANNASAVVSVLLSSRLSVTNLPNVDTVATKATVSLMAVLSKVRLEAFLWGVGTAIGELPPYFMARFARLSELRNKKEGYGHSPSSSIAGTKLSAGVDGQVVDEMDACSGGAGDFISGGNSVMASKDADTKKRLTLSALLGKAEAIIKAIIFKVGFWGILACASIPNPLFDIAGLTCGHFLVPFWTFFGATLIGKAVIKMHLQVFLVIVTFSKNHLHKMVQFVGQIPLIGKKLEAPFQEFLAHQHRQLHSDSKAIHQKQSWLQWIFEWLVLAMVLYFVLSIINSLAQSYQQRRRRVHKDSFAC